MGKSETVITAVSKKYVKQLTSSRQRIMHINTIPGVNEKALGVIRDYYVNNVGYDDIPIACLGRLNSKNVTLQSADSSIVDSGVLPMRGDETMLLEITLPADMIVSVDLEAVLCASRELDEAQSDLEVECIVDRLTDSLLMGIPTEEEGGTADMLSFIPFLDLTQCKNFSILDQSFNAQSCSTGSKWKTMPITQINAFL